MAIDIKEALYHFGTITGQIFNDELLGNIFANFCIGKQFFSIFDVFGYRLAVIVYGDWDADETDLLRKDTDKNGVNRQQKVD